MFIHLIHGKLAQFAGFEAIEIHMNNPLGTGGHLLDIQTLRCGVKRQSGEGEGGNNDVFHS